VNSRRDDYQDVRENTEIPEPSEGIVELYKQHIPDYLEDFMAAVAKQDEQDVLFHCHKMCSAVKTMGFENIAELLEAIQRERPSGDNLVEVSARVKKLIQHTLVLLDK